MDIGCLMSHIALPLKTDFSYLGAFVTLSDPLVDFLKSPSSSRPNILYPEIREVDLW